MCLTVIFRRNSTNFNKKAARKDNFIEARNKLNNCSGAVPALTSAVKRNTQHRDEHAACQTRSRWQPRWTSPHGRMLHSPPCGYRVRRSVTSAAGGAPEHLRPADPKLFATVSRQKSRHNNPGQLSSAVAQRLLRPSELCRWQPQHQNWECCGFHYLIFLSSQV